MYLFINRLYVVDANSHDACAAFETRLMEIRVSCTALTLGRVNSTQARSANL